MAQVLSLIPTTTQSRNVIISHSSSDDAGVYRLSDDLAIVQTVDFFTPIVDDPYLFGQIAAVNSLSDVWAMGGEPLTALAIAAFPVKTAGVEVCAEIMRGGAAVLAEYGVALLGGHTVEDEQLKFGYAVTGTVHPQRVISNAGALAGDVLVITKRLGTGIIGSGIKFQKASPEAQAAAVASMLQTNRDACAAMKVAGVHAATDITGFGMLGHAYQMARASRVTFRVDSEKLLLLPQVFELLSQGIKTKGDRTNRDYVGDAVEFAESVGAPVRSLMFDPQTSGGMLMSVAKERLELLLDELRRRGVEARACGEVVAQEDRLIKVT